MSNGIIAGRARHGCPAREFSALEQTVGTPMPLAAHAPCKKLRCARALARFGSPPKFSQNAVGLAQLKNSRGSVILPVIALAATVIGEAKKTCDSLCPMRPGKLRLVALMHFIGVFMRPKVSVGPPRQAAQLAFSVICTPASTRISQTVLSPQRDD